MGMSGSTLPPGSPGDSGWLEDAPAGSSWTAIARAAPSMTPRRISARPVAAHGAGVGDGTSVGSPTRGSSRARRRGSVARHFTTGRCPCAAAGTRMPFRLTWETSKVPCIYVLEKRCQCSSLAADKPYCVRFHGIFEPPIQLA
jgi:hypothetical protein